jgi:DNA-binding NarL/FixJ family response regulator
MSDEVEVVAEAVDGIGALEICEREQIDVLLLDLRMPRMDGYECLEKIRRQWPALPVVVLTVDEDPETSQRVMSGGAAAYVPKYIHPADLVSVVRQVAAGSILIVGSRGTARSGSEGRFRTRAEAYGLTERELQVLQLVAQGKTNSDIAKELFVTTKTVKFHLTGGFAKLQVSNRTEAAARALTHGLVPVQRSQEGE